MKKQFYIFVFLIGFSTCGFSQLKTYSFEEAEKLSMENPKPYLIFIKTDWCKICKMMKKSTFKNPEIITALNEDFYLIVLDAQSKTDIFFNGRNFRFIPNGIDSGIHELASELATIDGEIAYPTTVIVNQYLEIVGQKSGFIDAKSLLLLIKNYK